MTAALAVSQLDPEKVAEYAEIGLEQAETLVEQAQSFGMWVLHSAGLTEKEEYLGWLPLIELAFVAWKVQIKPTLMFVKAFGTEALALMNALRTWAGQTRHAVDVVTNDIAAPVITVETEFNNFVHWLGSL